MGEANAALVERVADFAPDMTVVTTAPTYLFWRCAQPELRVPRELLRGARAAWRMHGRGRPARLRDARRPRCASSAAMSSCAANARRSCAELADAADPLAVLPSIAFRDGERAVVTGRPHAARFTDLPALHWPAGWLARHHHHHHRYGSEAHGAGAEVEASRGCPYNCSFCAKIDFRDKYRRRDLASSCAGDRRPDRRGRDLRLFHRRDLPAAEGRCSKRWWTRPVEFGVQTRIDLWKPDMLDLLGAAGCVSIEAGVESLTVEGPRQPRQELPHVDRRAGRAADPCAAHACPSCRPT